MNAEIAEFIEGVLCGRNKPCSWSKIEQAKRHRPGNKDCSWNDSDANYLEQECNCRSVPLNNRLADTLDEYVRRISAMVVAKVIPPQLTEIVFTERLGEHEVTFRAKISNGEAACDATERRGPEFL